MVIDRLLHKMLGIRMLSIKRMLSLKRKRPVSEKRLNIMAFGNDFHSVFAYSLF